MINMNFSREWLLKVAKEEDGVRFSVGGWVSEIREEFDPCPAARTTDEGRAEQVPRSSTRELKANSLVNVFGQFLHTIRIEHGLTVQQLAEAIGIAPQEIVLLEEGKEQPEPRVVSKLAQKFGIPPRRLAQLAGHVVPDREVQDAALAFAASSSTKPLDAARKKAFNEFVKTLSKL
jgi:transcriptional regulator with XRE-family HTH domain